MPGDHGLRLHDEQCGAQVPPKAGESDAKYLIRCGETNSAALKPLQDGELVTQSNNLDLKRYLSPKARLQAGNRGNKKQGKHRMPRLAKALGKINDCNSNEIFSRHTKSPWQLLPGSVGSFATTQGWSSERIQNRSLDLRVTLKEHS